MSNENLNENINKDLNGNENAVEQNAECANVLPTVLSTIAILISIVALALTLMNIAGTLNAPSNDGEKPVVISRQYDKGQSIEKAMKKDKPMIVFFYTDWCGFCQRFAPTFAKITKDSAIKNNFAIAYVNCEDADNHKHMEEYGVQGFPTVYVVEKDGTKTHLKNETFFQTDSEKIVKEDILEIIEEDDKD